MADLAQLEAAFIKADDAGNTDDAQAFASEIKRLRSSPTAANAGSLPANAGLAKLAAGAAGLPGDTIGNVLNLGIAGFGAAKQAITGKPGPDLVDFSSMIGSRAAENALRATKMPGLNPDNPTPEDDLGTAQYNFVSRGGVIPGGALPAAGSMVAEAIGGPEWAGVGAMTPSAAIAAHNAARAPGLAKAQAQNTVRDATLKDAQEAGYVLPPSQVNPSFVGNRLESVAGKAALNQDAVLRNQQVTNALARKEVGLAENAPITEQALATQRAAFSAPYQEVAALSSRSKLWLEQLKDARHKANTFWIHYDRSADPNSLAAAKNLTSKATAIEAQIDNEAVRLQKPQLVTALREARTNIAKTYDVERALNLGDGNVDARILGRALDKGKRLSGGLEIAAKFAEAYPQLTRAAAGSPTPGVSALGPVSSAGLGIGGAAAWGPAGAALGALPFLRSPTRGMLLSDLYQQTFARPNYKPSMQPQGTLPAAGQLAIIANQVKQ